MKELEQKKAQFNLREFDRKMELELKAIKDKEKNDRQREERRKHEILELFNQRFY